MMSATQTIRTMCPMSCHPTLCGMLVDVNNDKLQKVRGDPDNPDSQGFLCVRGRASAEIIDNSKRLLKPLIRERRDSEHWREADWDEVLDLIVSRIQKVGPEATGLWLGHGDGATNYGTRIGGHLSRRFAHLAGCQWWGPTMICWGLGAFGLGLTGVLEPNTKEDMGQHSNLIICWGANLASQPNTARYLVAAKRRGARIVVIDVRHSEAAAQADEVLLIKPGTDTALALALMQVIVEQNLYDSDFVEQHTLGFAELKNHLRDFSAEWAAAITGIPATDIIELAKTYAQIKPAMIVLGGSSMHKDIHGWQNGRAIACLPALTGNLGVPGGGLGPRHGSAVHGQALANIVPPRTASQTPSAELYIPSQMSAITAALLNDQVKVMLLFGTNMLSSFADSHRLAAGLARADLIVSHDLFMQDTARQFADIVLPATAWLEQIGCKMTNTHLYLMEQALPAPAQTRTMSWILRQLAQRLQVDDFFPWENDEVMINAILDHPCTGHATIADLRAQGGIRALNISHVGHPDHCYSTPSQKIEFVSGTAQAYGLPALPVYHPLPESDYPLIFRQGRTLTHFHGFYDHGQALPSLARLDKQPQLWISPNDAEARNISNGDTIKIYNECGEFEACALVTDKIPTGTVWMRSGWLGINRLTSGQACLPDAAVEHFAFAAGQAGFDARVEVTRFN